MILTIIQAKAETAESNFKGVIHMSSEILTPFICQNKPLYF
jgi:hypothetical protein